MLELPNSTLYQILIERVYHENTLNPTVKYRKPGRNKLASGSWDNAIKIWNVDSGECIRTLAGHSGYVMALHLLSDTKLASGSNDSTIKIWNLDSGDCIQTLKGHSTMIFSLQLLAKNQLASGSSDFSVNLRATMPKTGISYT